MVNIATAVLHMLRTNFKIILCKDRIHTPVNTVMHTEIIITHIHMYISEDIFTEFFKAQQISEYSVEQPVLTSARRK